MASATRQEVIDWCAYNGIYTFRFRANPVPQGWEWREIYAVAEGEEPAEVPKEGPLFYLHKKPVNLEEDPGASTEFVEDVTMQTMAEAAQAAKDAEPEKPVETVPTYSDRIYKIQEDLEASGWSIEFHASDLPELTIWADYATKMMVVNNHKACYTFEVFDRIDTNVKLNLKDGHYVYEFSEGEVLIHEDDDTPWDHLFLTVRRHNPETDVRPPKEEPVEPETEDEVVNDPHEEPATDDPTDEAEVETPADPEQVQEAADPSEVVGDEQPEPTPENPTDEGSEPQQV